MIEISVNGEIKHLKEGLSIQRLIETLGYKEKGFAVAVNMTFVPIADYEKIIIKEGDKIDILAPVQGG